MTRCSIRAAEVHPSSGRTYAYDYNPPKVLGKDLSMQFWEVTK